MSYARFKNIKKLDFAPANMMVIEGDKIVQRPYTVERLIEDGYKLVNFPSEDPGSLKKYCFWEMHYTEFEDHIDGAWFEIEASEEEKKQMEIDELKAYLDSTDYIHDKCAETGEDITVVYAEVLAERARARARVQELEG